MVFALESGKQILFSGTVYETILIHYDILLFVALNLLGKFAVGVDGFGQINT